MRSRKSVCLSALVVMLLAVPALAEDKMGKDKQVDQKLTELREAYMKAVSSGDVDKLLTLYTDDFVVMAPFEPPVTGKNNLRANFSENMKRYDQSMTIESQETRVFEDWAYDRGTLKMTRKPKTGTGETSSLESTYVVLLKKQPNGDWKLARVIYNFNERPPATFLQTE